MAEEKRKPRLSPIKPVCVSGRSSGFQLFIAIPQDPRIYALKDKRSRFLNKANFIRTLAKKIATELGLINLICE